ncbi:MAG: pyridoxamine 5'-phosphate oxidase [Verrucomicrobiota bacterium]|jgi:pyridoxamine 5'-phosphate oxidase
MNEQEVQDLRRNYTMGDLDESSVAHDPVDQFGLWFEQACKAQLLEPNAMSLATSTPEGQTSIRTVLLKGYGKDGFNFFTNMESNKALEIGSNPNVSLLFPWLALERQVIINGTAESMGRAEVLKYFVTRPVDSQIGAWASNQSRIITTRKILEMKFDELKRKFADGKVPLPSFWGGFRVVPRTVEFWQGRPSRLHDRIRYSLNEQGKWQRARLAP